MGAATKAAPTREECEKSWEHPPELEGWAVSHNALKKDMDTFSRAVAALQKTLAGGKPLAAWQVDAVKTFWTQFGTTVVDHHMHEEEYFFPWLATRNVELEKVSADHKTLLQLEKEVDILVARFKAEMPVEECKALLAELATKFEVFQGEMKAHLDEEENEVVPVMRRTFKQQEERKVVAAMVSKMGKFEGAATVWHMPPAERTAFMNRVGIPKPVQWLIFNPRTKQYDRLYQQPIKGVIDGTPPPAAKKGWFW